MNSLIEQVLSLPENEKIELYQALHDNLGLHETEELEIISEVESRQQSIQNGMASFMSGDELLNKLRALQHELHSKRS